MYMQFFFLNNFKKMFARRRNIFFQNKNCNLISIYISCMEENKKWNYLRNEIE